MQFTIDLPHVFCPGSQPVDDSSAVRSLLDLMIKLNLDFLRDHRVPSLYRSGVVYRRTQVWDTIPALYARGYGDCKTLSAALIAERRNRGLKALPTFRSAPGTVNGQPVTNYHILVQTPEGFEDPSKVLGMGQNENSYFQR